MTEYVDWRDERANDAIQMPKRLVCPETGRTFGIREWTARIAVGELVSIKTELIVSMDEGDE
ncbi:hypothetical protein TBK1r_60270 [Stieleria magnilauensis]|uniref:Uncharacterized protein n=1 Tax=Stieleria magnilauensis TaxID=2527963 RepID=A0ABX5XY95_9BACT|nr:hypothetical protein TBK1r_59490 [Planctomycetes bacterium TBK1r]QDV87000.1 hypothetical protein TBK1r_60270 [Planctomycetes bacterium TBK1r]